MATYRPPGVSVQLQRLRGLASNLGAADTLLIMGQADNFPLTNRENIQLSGETLAKLAKPGIDDGSIQVFTSASVLLAESTDYEVTQTTDAFGIVSTFISKTKTLVTDEAVTFTGAGSTVSLANANLFGTTDPQNPEVVVQDNTDTITYDEGVDYVIDYTNGTITHIVGGAIGNTATVHVDYSWATIANGASLRVEYDSTPTDLYEVQTWDDLQTAVNFYGDPMVVGQLTPNSHLSLALLLISGSLTGAQLPKIKTLAVDPAGDPDSAPTTVEPTDWLAAYNDKVSGEDVTHLTVLSADRQVWQYTNAFLTNQAAQNRFTRGFIGPDANIDMLGAANGAPIFGFNSSRLQVVDIEQIPWRNPLENNVVLLPGYFVAAVLAAQECTLPRSTPMTHKQIAGFEQLTGKMLRSENAKNQLAQSGVTVIENRGLALWVRHSKTTALTGAADEEPSITRVFDFMRADLKASFEEKFIGTGFFVDDPTKFAIEAEAENRMSQYVSQGDITNFSTPTVNVGSDPRTFEVHCQVDPRFPLNNLDFFLLVNA